MPSIQERFDTLLISTELANRLIGRRAPGEVTYEESEQGDARRRLLHIEKLAAEQKASEAKAHAQKIKEVSDELHKRIVEKLQPQFASVTSVAVSILSLSEDVTLLLDTLSTRACSVSGLEPIIAGLPWLHEAIIKDINSPENRRIDGNGKPIIIESIRTALSTIGIENLRIQIPFFILKNSIPQITDPFPQIKSKLAEHSIAMANTMSRLASMLELRKFDAYVLGMMSNLGICASTRQYFREYDKTLREYSQEVMDLRDQSTYQALQLIQPSGSDLTRLYQGYAKPLTARALEYMPFKRINLIQPWSDSEHPLNEVFVLAKRFVTLKMLIRYRLIEKDEAKAHLATLKIPAPWLEELNKPGLFKLAVDYSGS